MEGCTGGFKHGKTRKDNIKELVFITEIKAKSEVSISCNYRDVFNFIRFYLYVVYSKKYDGT